MSPKTGHEINFLVVSALLLALVMADELVFRFQLRLGCPWLFLARYWQKQRQPPLLFQRARDLLWYSWVSKVY
jgi:hypothetical protein